MSTTDARKMFDRNPPAELSDEETPLAKARRYMETTNNLFLSFGWEPRPVGRYGYFRWDAPSPNSDGALYRTYAETSGDGASFVWINVPDDDDDDDENTPRELLSNNIQIFSRLIEIHRTLGIGRFDVDKFMEVILNLLTTANGFEHDALNVEQFAAIGGYRPIQQALEKMLPSSSSTNNCE